MKKIILLFFIGFSFGSNSYSQNFNWITPNKTYLKLYVNDDGIYRINKSDFINAGINTNNIDPRTVKVLYKGNQIPIYFEGEDDGVFNDNDFLDFYGKRNKGGFTQYRDGFSNAVLYTTDEYYNLYSDTSVYWIDWGGGNGLRMQRSSFSSSLNYPDNYFVKKVHFEHDDFYYLGQTSNPNSDFKYFSTERVAGESWFWRSLENQESLVDSVLINDLSNSSQTCNLKVFIIPVSFINSIINEHRVEVRINSVVIDTLETDNFTKMDTTITFSASLLNNNSYNRITLHYIPIYNPNYSPVIFIDYFELSYPRDFKIRNSSLTINLFGSDTTSKKFKLNGYNSSSALNIYDIKNNIRIENFSNNTDTLTFSGKSNSSFEVVNAYITKKPFRIISRQVKGLTSNTIGADYIIVYNKIFESQSEQLKNHRQSFDTFRVSKAEMQDIYDIFNYGMEDPVSVRNFIKYAYDNWEKPRVKYVCLFGRASLDPKRNNPLSDFYQNLVPTYGNPPTDGYFVNFNLGTFTYYHQISVGRIPAYTPAEAQDIVDKITNYDIQQPEKWWKKFIFITGGPDRNQQITFQAQSNYFINTYINPCPISGQVSKIYRNDSTGYITYNYKDSIKREFDRGAMIVNFIGHAASQDWEIGLEDPNTLNNGNKLPLIFSMTCFTGKNSEPNFRSFGEKFLTFPNKCAIGFVGSTGWSFVNSGNTLDEYLLKGFSRDSLRRMGEIFSYATKFLSVDSNSFAARNTINSYNLLGDPATNLLITRKPEFDIKLNDYTLSNPFPSLREIIKLAIFPKDLGTCADSCRIRFRLIKNGATSQRKDTVVRNLNYIDTINYFFSIDTAGNYKMSVTLDPDHSYAQKFTNNDSIIFPLTLRNLSYVPLKPLNSSLVKTEIIKFTGLNPNVNPRGNSIKVILQVDTSRNFNSPAAQTFNNNNINGVTTSFNISLPVQLINTLYFLRTNAIINSDSTGWSEIQKFIYNPNQAEASGENSEFAADSITTIFMIKSQQYQEQDLSNVGYDSSGFFLNKFIGNLFVKSQGSNANEASYFTINNINFYSDGGANTGLNIAKVRKLTGVAKEIENFRMNSPISSDSVLNFLNTFDTTEYIMAYIASHVPDSDSLRVNAKAKFRQFGSIYADSVLRFDQFTTWAFIGFLGADANQICEDFHRYIGPLWTPSICQLNPLFQRTFGTISQMFGPAHRWNNFSWDQILFPNSSISFDVYGIDRGNKTVPLYSNLQNNSIVNLDTIDSYQYSNLKLDAKLLIDTIFGSLSPIFKSLKFKYIPPAELVPDNYSFVGIDSAVQEGDSLSFKVNYYNVGFVDAQAVVNKWYINNQGIEFILKKDTILSTFKIDSMRTSEVKFSTSHLRNPKKTKDTINLYFETSLFGRENEIYSYNNTAITKFIVTGDTVKPVIDVTYDGIKIQNGDFVQSKPKILLNILDDSRMVIRDTSNVKVYKDNKYVPYYINGIKNPEIDITFPDDRFLQAIVIYKPTLDQGEHKFRYVTSDITGNFADSIVNIVIVDNNLRIFDMANYPNPMKTETNFMFRLSGEINPTTCKVRIYSVAGRLVKEINAPANIGYNQIYWDGKDDDGDYMANGTYLYKFIIQGNSKNETTIKKLAILR